MTQDPRRERLAELLADKALTGLDAAEAGELAHLMTQGVGTDDGSFEKAAAAVALAEMTYEAMPARLAARIEEEAMGALPTTMHRPKDLLRTVPMPDRPLPPSMPAAEPMRPSNVVPLQPKKARVFAAVGWIAAAACLLLAIGAWTLRGKVPTSVAVAPQVERDRLLARAGTTKLDWSATKDPASVAASGDVVWNAAEQKGFMRFKGLAKNDKNGWQYQLWIFDKNRDDRYPVDGGVFDVDRDTGDVVVPIKAALPVGEIALFAVTVEKPGGVVVSKRERIVVTAKPAG
jgi:hypothetical protein